MLHGLLLGSLASWYFTAAPTLARTHSVLLYDLRGHGRSDKVATGYDVATMVGDLSALTADYRHEPMTLVGHSYGALIALRFALDHPERVARLIIVEAPLPPSKIGELRAFLDRTPEEMVATLPDEMRAFFERGSRQSRRLLRSLHFLVMQSSLAADLDAEPDIPDDVLATIECPVSCVYGATSSCRHVGDRLAAAIPNAELLELPGGHYLHLDCSEALTKHIAEFANA
jgi:pimeloyl-ACP methyl ester carboxylesterase